MEEIIDLEDVENLPTNTYKKTIDSIHELSSDNSLLITEKIIFEGKKSNLNKFKIGRYYLYLPKLILSFFLFRKIIPSILFLFIKNEKFMIQLIFLSLSILYFLPFFIHFICRNTFSHYKELKFINFYYLTNSFFYCLFYFILFLFSMEIFNVKIFFYIISFSFIFYTFILYFFRKNQKFVYFYLFLEWFQNFFIIANFVYNFANWDIALLYYEIFSIFLFLMSILIFVFFLILIIYYIFSDNNIFGLNSYIILYFINFVFFVIWNGIVFYYLLYCIKTELNGNINFETFFIIQKENFKIISLVTLILSSINLLISIIFFFIMYYLLKKFKNDSNRILSEISFTKNLKLGLIRASELIFKRRKSVNEETMLLIDKREKHKILCFICKNRENNILIRPCGHTGLCHICMENYLQNNDFCPVCSINIDKCYIIFFDKELNAYVISKVIKYIDK